MRIIPDNYCELMSGYGKPNPTLYLRTWERDKQYKFTACD